MAFAGEIGVDAMGLHTPTLRQLWPMTSSCSVNSTTRFVVEVKPEHAAAFRAQLKDVPLSLLPKTVADAASANRRQQRRMAHWAKLGELKEAWQRPLRW